MRLWHEALIPHLPRQQLLGQHRECCALRGNGWGKPHATVNYVFEHPYEWLWAYHIRVMEEMLNRGYKVNPIWYPMSYRGHTAPSIVYYPEEALAAGSPDWARFPEGCYKPAPDIVVINKRIKEGCLIYPEHDEQYLKGCLENLAGKGIVLEVIK